MTNEAKIAHLGFIQGVVNRMGANSFLLKGWCITLVAAIFVLSAKDADQKFALLTYFPVIVFWVLDAYFVRQEKLYRVLYERVATNVISSDSFSLDTGPVQDAAPSIGHVAFSKTVFTFHASIVGVCLFGMFVLMS